MRFPLDDAPPVAIMRYQVDLDAPARPGEDGEPRTRADTMGLAVRPLGSAGLEREQLRAAIGAALGRLRLRHRLIVSLLFALDGGPEVSMPDLARLLRCTRSNLWQTYRRAMRDLQRGVEDALRAERARRPGVPEPVPAEEIGLPPLLRRILRERRRALDSGGAAVAAALRPRGRR